MGLKRALAVVGGVAASAVIGNTLLERLAEPLGDPLGREVDYYRWRGMDIAVTTAGDPEAQDLVLLHGIHPAATSKEFSGIIDELAETYHVIAPDLPGFGQSDRPPLFYSARLYEEFLQEFLTETTDSPICIASSLSSAYAVAVSEQVDFSHLVLVCPRTAKWGRRPLVRTLLRLPVVGSMAFNVLVSRPALAYQLRRRDISSGDALSEEDRAYYWQTAHQPGARFAPASYLGGYLNPEIDIGDELAERDIPTTLIWGRKARRTSVAAGRSLAEQADATLVVIDRAKEGPHLDHPDAVLDIIDGEESILRD